jgi:hypothetical protein
MAEDRLLKVAQLAERSQVSQEAVRRMVRNGRMHGKLLGGNRASNCIPGSGVERFSPGAPLPARR